MRTIHKSHKLDDVLYDIRGPVLTEAQRLEGDGYKILKLNTGNPAPFGLLAPDEITHDMIINLNTPQTQGYSDSKGLFSARKAIMQYCQEKGIANVGIEDIYTGNGVSEAITMSMQALLNKGDEILIPSPDYPLWTASVRLSGGTPVHYVCDEKAGWLPDIRDIKRKIASKTKGIAIINPNNPTGVVYPRAILEQIVKVAQERQLIVFSDEIYDKILYDGVEHTATASLADDILFVTFNGLSKAYRIAGFRVGWMVVSGDKKRARDYIEGLTMLASMRLCSNVPAQSIVQTALGGHQTIRDLCAVGGRLRQQRDICCKILTGIDGLTFVKPQAAFYLFPKLDMKKFNIHDDQQMVLDLLREKHILLVHGRGFNWPHPDHVRIVFLPAAEELTDALTKFREFLGSYRQK